MPSDSSWSFCQGGPTASRHYSHVMLSKLDGTEPQTHTRIELEGNVMQRMQERGWVAYDGTGWWITEAGRIVLAEARRRQRMPR